MPGAFGATVSLRIVSGSAPSLLPLMSVSLTFTVRGPSARLERSPVTSAVPSEPIVVTRTILRVIVRVPAFQKASLFGMRDDEFLGRFTGRPRREARARV